jgi:hypothetical protein
VKLGSVTSATLFQYDQGGHLLEQTGGTGTAQVDYMYFADLPNRHFSAKQWKDVLPARR